MIDWRYTQAGCELALYDADDRIYGDALILFSRETANIVASRAPASMFPSGSLLEECFPGSGERICNALSTADRVGLTVWRVMLRHSPRQKLGECEFAEDIWADQLFVCPLGTLSSPIAAILPMRLDDIELNESPCRGVAASALLMSIFDRALMISIGDHRAVFYEIPYILRLIAHTSGVGMSWKSQTDSLLMLKPFDSEGFFGIILVLALMFRRCSARRGLNVTVGMSDDVPIFCFDALLANDADDPPELQYIRRFMSTAMYFDRFTIDSVHGKRLAILLSPWTSTVRHTEFKASLPWERIPKPKELLESLFGEFDTRTY